MGNLIGRGEFGRVYFTKTETHKIPCLHCAHISLHVFDTEKCGHRYGAVVMKTFHQFALIHFELFRLCYLREIAL